MTPPVDRSKAVHHRAQCGSTSEGRLGSSSAACAGGRSAHGCTTVLAGLLQRIGPKFGMGRQVHGRQCVPCAPRAPPTHTLMTHLTFAPHCLCAARRAASSVRCVVSDMLCVRSHLLHSQSVLRASQRPRVVWLFAGELERLGHDDPHLRFRLAEKGGHPTPPEIRS